jgi:hypothetical protein
MATRSSNQAGPSESTGTPKLPKSTEPAEQIAIGIGAPPGVQMQPALLGLGSVEQLQELYRLNPGLFNSFNSQSTAASIHSGVQSLLSTVKTSTPSVTTPLTLNTGSNTPKFLLHGTQQTPHAFLDSGTAQLFFPTPPTPQMGNFGVPFLNTNPVAAIRAALQQQIPPMFSGIPISSHGVGQPIQVGTHHWPTQFDPAQFQHVQASTSKSQPIESAPEKPLSVDVTTDEDKNIDVMESPKPKHSKANSQGRKMGFFIRENVFKLVYQRVKMS